MRRKISAKFVGELILRYRDVPVDGKWFQVWESFGYYAESKEIYRIPENTNTDFATIPKGFRWMISRVGKYGKAAVLHDWLCEYKIVSRKKADKLFLEAMKVCGVGWFKRRTMYMGVRTYSIVTFKK